MPTSAGLFWRSFGASWGVLMVVESGELVKPASGERTWRSFSSVSWIASIAEFCLVCITAGEDVGGHHRVQGFCHRYI
jgi:hypothetical protein